MLPLLVQPGLDGRKIDIAKNALSSVGLAEKAASLPSQLSGGEQERVAIARAIVNRPPIILADEPTGNLDTKTGDQVLDILTKLNEEGRTIIMVTHSSENARRAGRIIKLKDGEIVWPCLSHA